MSETIITPQTFEKVRKLLNEISLEDPDVTRPRLLAAWGKTSEEKALALLKLFEDSAAASDKAKPTIDALFGKDHPALNVRL